MSDELDYMSLFEEDIENDYEPIKAPFAWTGGKGRSVDKLREILPYDRMYVEPFGGSGVVLLARRPVITEVFNDRSSAIVDFYRCLKDPVLMEQLYERLELATYSREEWLEAKESWTRASNPVERAALWYTMIEYSFSNMGRNLGRTGTSKSKIAGKLRNKLPLFPRIHERVKNVFLENCDWSCIFRDYKHEEAVFYCDPPYLGTDQSMYSGSTWTIQDQAHLLKAIFDHPGYVALSSYSCKLNDAMPWDDVYEWEVRVTVKGGGNKDDHSNKRETNKEVLYVKEAY